jgi:polyisoprenoid-binding protein YceI
MHLLSIISSQRGGISSRISQWYALTIEERHSEERAVKRPPELVLRVVLVLGFLTILLFSSITEAQSSEGAPSYKITPVASKIEFNVKASIPIEGTFEKWDAALAFGSTDPSTGSLDIKIQADSVNTGSKSKDSRLKGKSCFDVQEHPYITFRSTKIIETGPHTFDVQGTFTIRGVSKPESLTFTADREGTGTGEVKGTLWFDRRDFELGGSIPFVKIADRVELTVDFKATRVSGPALLFKQ